ncbi:MAG: DNA-binding response regulator [Clostridium sp. 44_14]|nr:MAG: DNA-binding response regulator [Clostridium sp. 44_14]
MNKILIVEDDVNINNLLKEALSGNGYTCGQAFSGTEAALWLEKESWALVLLDLMLPEMTGEEVLGLIRRQGDVPVIVLTAKDALAEKLELLTNGADDYITKPFDIQEVVARVQIQLRHAGREQAPDRISCGEISLEKGTHQIWIGGKELEHLTRQEFAILELLLEHPGQVFSKEAIFTYAWQEEYMGETKTLDVHISNIRKKLKSLTEKEYIQTVWGIGYRLQPSK